MAPVRGIKNRRKTLKKRDKNVSAAASGTPENEGYKLSKWMNGSQECPSKCLGNFGSVSKISTKTFEYICSLVKDDLMSKSAFMFTNGQPMSLYDQVAVALRRLGSGESLASIGDSVGLNHSAVSQVTWRFVESMEQRGLHHLQWPSTEMEMIEIKSKFEKIQGLPNCCGVIDATHFTLCLPTTEPSYDMFLDHMNKHSMVMQAIVDPDMRFMDIVTGWPGMMKEWLVFNSSTFKELCEKEKRLNGIKLVLPEGSEIREYIIGDSAYPLLPYLVVPYEENDELSETKAEFNRLHFETRMVAQRALARLKETWRIIHGIVWRPDIHRLPRIILVCCMLHNILIDMQDPVQDELSKSHDHDNGYNQLICGAVDQKGVALRENLSLYLTGNLHT